MFGRKKTQQCRSTPRTRGLFKSGYIVMAMVSSAHASSLDDQIQRLTADITRHTANVYALEQKLLHPVDTRVIVFLSIKDSDALELDSVELFVNQKPVTAHLYSDKERHSLGQGGIHQLFVGNLSDGPHSLRAVINARGANNRFVRRELVHDFRKESGTLHLQMRLSANAPDYDPDVSFSEWK